MNTGTKKSDWDDVKGKIKLRFEKLTDESIESVKGNLDLLSEKLQTAYGYAKENAERELKGFKDSLHEVLVISKITPITPAKAAVRAPSLRKTM